jgi:hypothetical protein
MDRREYSQSHYIGYLSPAVDCCEDHFERNEGSPKMPIKDNSLMGIFI